MYFKFLFFLLLALAGGYVSAQNISGYNPGRVYTIDELKADITALRVTLEEINPALYRFRTKDQVDSLFNTLLFSIDKPLTAAEATRDLILPAITFIQDLHFVVYPSAEAEEYLRANGKYFPFDIKLEGDKIYVWRNLSATKKIPEQGIAEIVSINGEPAAKVLNTVRQYIVTDGNSVTSKKKADLEANFRTYYSIAYGRPADFQLFLKTEDGNISSATVKAQLWKDLSKAKTSKANAEADAIALRLEKDKKMAVLTLKTFNPANAGMNDKAMELFIDSAFKAIKAGGIEELILDLRGNIGGRINYGGTLFAYLTNKPFQYIDHITVKFPHTFPYINNTSLSRSYLTSTYGIRPAKDGTYNLETFQWLQTQEASENAFNGQLYVLTDGYTMSTTSLFCSMILAFRNNTTFIGQETGGAYGMCSGMLTLLTLPNTQTRVYLPLRNYVSTAYNRPEKNNNHIDRGILPDIVVERSIEDLRKDTDPVMEKAIQLTGK